MSFTSEDESSGLRSPLLEEEGSSDGAAAVASAEASIAEAKANDDIDEKLEEVESQHREELRGLNRELTERIGSDKVATYENYVDAQRRLRLRRKRSVSASLSASCRSRREIEVIQNVANRTNSVAWIEISKDLGITDDEEGRAINIHNTTTPFYSPPVQRQRYGDDKILPPEGWGEMFFDLFFVGAASNL